MPSGFAETVPDRHALLRDLGDERSTILLSRARAFAAGRGTLLAREGHPTTAFYLIQSGRVALTTYVSKRGTSEVVQTAGPDEAIGIPPANAILVAPGEAWERKMG